MYSNSPSSVGSHSDAQVGRLAKCADRLGGQVNYLSTLLDRISAVADRLGGTAPAGDKEGQPLIGGDCVASQFEQVHRDFTALMKRMDEATKRLESL